MPSLHVVSIVASAIGETSAYHWFLSIVESARAVAGAPPDVDPRLVKGRDR
jgi:hypothetical protein